MTVELARSRGIFLESCIPLAYPYTNKGTAARIWDAVVRAFQVFPAPCTFGKNKSLCSLCRRLTYEKLLRGCYHHRSLDSLRICAQKCELCALFLQAFEAGRVPPPDAWPRRIYLTAVTRKTTNLQLWTNDTNASVRLFCEQGDSASKALLGRPIRDHAGDPANFQLAKRWLDNCVYNHPECTTCEEDLDPMLPSRVLRVSRDGELLTLRLLITKKQRGKWVALSHCWGSEPILCLYKENELDLQKQIPLSCLPQTFQDAVLITWRLGLQYLWIDSLCIQQNSTDDWQAESVHMPTIYASAHLVLRANATPNSSHGLLKPRVLASCRYKLGNLGEIGIGQAKCESVDYLDERAWCFQEEQLGHRRLTYYQDYMEFGCDRLLGSKEDVDCESLRDNRTQDEIVAQMYCTTFARVLKKHAHLLDQQHGNASEEQARMFDDYWTTQVSEYSRRLMTNPGDKLMAISGVARQMGAITGDRYLAGLWRSQLMRGLLWHGLHSRKYLKAPAEYRAPSWSWASTDGEIIWPYAYAQDNETYSCDIEEVEVIPASSDLYGQVVSGYIRIKARAKHVAIGPVVTFESPMGPHKLIHYQSLVDLEGDESIGTKPVCHLDRNSLDEGTVVMCVELFSGYKDDMAFSQALIVARFDDDDGSSQTVRRIGMMSLSETRYEFESSKIWFDGCAEQVITIV